MEHIIPFIMFGVIAILALAIPFIKKSFAKRDKETSKFCEHSMYEFFGIGSAIGVDCHIKETTQSAGR